MLPLKGFLEINLLRLLFPPSTPITPPHPYFPSLALPAAHTQRLLNPFPLVVLGVHSAPPLVEAVFLLFVQVALFTLCAGNELFYCLLYLFSFSEGPLGKR